MKMETKFTIKEGTISKIITDWVRDNIPNVAAAEVIEVELVDREWAGVRADITAHVEIDTPGGE